MLGSVVRERVFDNSNNFNQRILGLLPETARSMLPFSFESENRTVRGILSRGGRELLPYDQHIPRAQVIEHEVQLQSGGLGATHGLLVDLFTARFPKCIELEVKALFLGAHARIADLHMPLRIGCR